MSGGTPAHHARGVTRPRRLRDLILLTLSVCGWGLGLAAWFHETGGAITTGVDLAAYLRAGRDLAAGLPVYTTPIGDSTAFAYAPPWAILFAALSVIPGALIQLAIVLLDLAALRYLTGSWRAVGYVIPIPMTIFLIDAGNIDLLIAAAIVMAWRGNSGPLAAFALAKIAPVLAVPRAHLRQAFIVAAVSVAITLPWLRLWPEWVAYLVSQPASIAISIPIPWFVRLPFALALLLVRRPWAAGLAAVLAMPSFYLSTLLILLAPLRLYLDGRSTATPPVPHLPLPDRPRPDRRLPDRTAPSYGT